MWVAACVGGMERFHIVGKKGCVIWMVAWAAVWGDRERICGMGGTGLARGPDARTCSVLTGLSIENGPTALMPSALRFTAVYPRLLMVTTLRERTPTAICPKSTTCVGEGAGEGRGAWVRERVRGEGRG